MREVRRLQLWSRATTENVLKKSCMMGEPAASLAHEIKQPLAAAVTHESLRQLEAILAHINRVSEC
jgi:C4-dicarboxylate-specific signal transduction histidine kinase